MTDVQKETRRVEAVCTAFNKAYGGSPTHAAVAPGRVNLIGEHTDYNGGFVLPLAIQYSTLIVARPREDGRAVVRSTGVAGVVEFGVGPGLTPGEPGWGNYIKGAVAGCLEAGLTTGGFEALLDSTVPAGGGLSSSASIEVATATLMEALAGRTIDPIGKAMLCQAAEHNFAGMPCGIMDQFIVTMGKAGHVLLIDCRSHETKAVPLDDPGVQVLVINSNVKHALTDGEYAKRRARCESTASVLGVGALRDATMRQLDTARDQLDPTAYRRARHVITENERTLATVEALEARDWATVGKHMYASHNSLRDDFEVSTPELDTLVELASGIGEAGGVIGSRMTGGGFGGCTVTLVRTEQAQAVSDAICTGYLKRVGKEATPFITRPADGARVITL